MVLEDGPSNSSGDTLSRILLKERELSVIWTAIRAFSGLILLEPDYFFLI